jgi:nucleoside-diphosphate-sugar epimerase
MWSSSGRVLVAGAGGFIGGQVVSVLREYGVNDIRAVDVKPIETWYQRFEDVECVTADLKSKEESESAMQGVSVVFNLAADMGGMGYIERHKVNCMRSVLINTNLIEAAAMADVERYFFSSSACVYNGSLQESSVVEGLREVDAYPALAEDGYGWEKLFSERMCHHYLEEYGLQVRVARYHNVYGPSGTWDGGREKAPAAICRKVAQAKLSGGDEIEIWGDGQQGRSFMYIDDCVEGTIRLVESEFTDPLNIGSSRLVSINTLVDIIEAIAGVQLKRQYNLEAPLGVRGRTSDNSLIRSTLEWEPMITLEDGLEKTYAWIYDQLKAGSSEPGMVSRQ